MNTFQIQMLDSSRVRLNKIHQDASQTLIGSNIVKPLTEKSRVKFVSQSIDLESFKEFGLSKSSA